MNKECYLEPVAICKSCKKLLTGFDFKTKYIQRKENMRVERLDYCRFCGNHVLKEDFFEPYRSMMK